MKKKHPAAWALFAQALGMALLGAAAACCAFFLSGRALGLVHGACIWLLQPALGAFLAFRCAVKGVPAILAWLPAPPCFAGAYWLVVGMAPSLGAAALCALCAVLFASAGEVWLKRSITSGK